MIKSLKKLSRKHYIQCGLAVLLTGIVLYFTSALWLSRNVVVSFNTETEKDIQYQVFYTDASNSNGKTELYAVKAGSNFVKIEIPTENIKSFRLDPGSSNPGNIIISDLQIKGSYDIKLNYSEFEHRNIDKFEVKNGKLYLTSNQGDPYLPYKSELNLPAGYQIDWCRLIIISVLSFLMMYKFVQYLSKFKIEKQHSRIDIVMLAVFFALLFVPMSHISDAEKSEQENRMLARKPQLTIDNKGGNYGVQFDAWYNDHFFGRDIMIYLYNYINFVINPGGFSEKAMIGKDGWLFLKHFTFIYENSRLFTEQELGLIGKNINSFIKKASDLGFKKVYFLLSNVREIMYGEYYPDYVKKKGNMSRLKQLLLYMNKEYPNIKFLNFEDKLRDLKKKETIFYKTGTHMNNIGAYYEYYFLMNEVKKDNPELNILTLKDFDITVSDDINQPGMDLDLYRYFTVIPWYNKENFKNKILTLKSSLKDEVKITRIIEDYPARTFKERENDNLPYKLTATVISDSFGRRYENYLPYSFSRVSHLYIGAAAPFILSKQEKDYIIDNPSDILIIETVESVVERFLNDKFPQNLIKEN